MRHRAQRSIPGLLRTAPRGLLVTGSLVLLGAATGVSLAAYDDTGVPSSGRVVQGIAGQPAAVPASSPQAQAPTAWLTSSPDGPSAPERPGEGNRQGPRSRTAPKASESRSKLPEPVDSQAPDADPYSPSARVTASAEGTSPAQGGISPSEGSTSPTEGGGTASSDGGTSSGGGTTSAGGGTTSAGGGTSSYGGGSSPSEGFSTPTPSPSPTPRDLVAPDTSATTLVRDAGTWTISVGADETATFECSLDGGAYQVCGSTVTFHDLAKGVHSFSARATDRAGNTDPSPAQLTTKVTGRGMGKG